MTQAESSLQESEPPLNLRLAVLLAMAMFVLVVDTSLMNVSISAVVEDLDTTVSGVQSAISSVASEHMYSGSSRTPRALSR
jgi:hypothetical protein